LIPNSATVPMSLKINLVGLFTFILSLGVYAQNKKDSVLTNQLVQFSGFVVTSDSSSILPYTSIKIKGTNRGSYADMQGYFSLVAKENDIIVFSCIGFEPKYFTVPQTNKTAKINTVITLVEDTFFLPEMVFKANPSPEEFEYMFSRINVPMDQLTIAQNNLRVKPLLAFGNGLQNDGLTNSSWTFNQVANRAYYAGQMQPMPVLDVFAWTKFVNSLGKGNYKKKR
jgi:hypothetical protein